MIKEIMPPNLLQDENIKALVESIEPEFEKVKSEIINVLIYPRIDQLSEEILDLLAYQFHVEGYELATTIEEKRNLIKKAIELHRYKGTKYAVEKACEALNITPIIKEWFEYNGQPFHFKVYIDSIPSEDSYNKLISFINEYKNLRSYLELLGITSQSQSSVYTSTFLNRGKKYDLGIHFEIPDEISELQIGFSTIKARKRNISVSIPSINIKTSNSYIASTLQYARKTIIEVA